MSRARDTANQINRVNSSAADATALTVDSSENVLIGQTTASSGTVGTSLRSDGRNFYCADGNYSAHFNRNSSDGAIVHFAKDDTIVGSVGVEGADLTIGTGTNSGLQFFDGGSSVRPFNMASNSRVDNAIDLGESNTRFKDLYLSGGVYLGGTGSANKLDDFETGHWTPTLPNGGTVGTVHDSTYVKVGNLVTVYCNADLTPTNNSSAFQIGNLPFSQNNNGNHGGGAISYVGGMDVRHWSNPLVHDSSNKIYFHRHDNSSDVIRNAEFGGSQKQFIVQIAYMLG